MKKEVTVRVAARKASTTKKQVVCCDFCGATLKGYANYGHQEKCCVCKRDICRTHTKYDPNEPGDYPDNYCPVCYHLRYEVHDETYRQLEAEHAAAIEDLDRVIKELSLETKI